MIASIIVMKSRKFARIQRVLWRNISAEMDLVFLTISFAIKETVSFKLK
jgi:hypothetical protein